MTVFKKENTYLHLFELNSKVQYMFVTKAKWIAWPVLFIMCLCGVLVFSLPIQVLAEIFFVIQDFMGNDLFSSPWYMFISYSLSTGVTILAFFTYIRVIEKRPFHTIGLVSRLKLKKYIKGAVIAIIMQLTYFCLVLVLGFAKVQVVPEQSAKGFGVQTIGFVFLYLIMFVIQGASEEVTVRGWLFPVLSRHYSLPVAIFLSSLFFGSMHLLNPNVAMLPIINLVLYGVFASLYAIYDDGLWGIFAHHSIWNWFMGNVLGLPVSGLVPGGVSIFKTSISGPAMITGGEFGPEGGLIVTVMLTAACGVTYYLINGNVKSRSEMIAVDESN